MGRILNTGGCFGVYIEQRRESFTIYTPFGDRRIELDQVVAPALIAGLIIAEHERARLQERVIQNQAATLEHLATPLIPIDSGTVVMPLVGAIDSLRAHLILRALRHGIEQLGADVAILDIAGIAVVDDQVGRVLGNALRTADLLRARIILTGIRPEIAQTLIGLGLDLSKTCTRATLYAGIIEAVAGR